MKKHFLFILISFLIIFTFCSPKEAEVKIKAGVVMKSGDVKNVARQEFFLAKTDVVSLWEASKREHLKDLKLIVEEIKVEMDYENEINKLENEIRKYQKSISSKESHDNPSIKRIVEELFKNINTSISRDKDAYIYENIIEGLNEIKEGKKYSKFWSPKNDIEVTLRALDYIYTSNIKEDYSGEKHIDFYKAQLEDVKRIGRILDDYDTEINKDKAKINKFSGEINKLKEELKSKSNEKYEHHKKKAISDFQIKLKENFIKSFMTNLNGEASFKIKKGHYFLFGIIQIGESDLIWNLPVSIEKKDHYIELSNDNALAIDDILIFELLEALEGFEINNSN